MSDQNTPDIFRLLLGAQSIDGSDIMEEKIEKQGMMAQIPKRTVNHEWFGSHS